MEGLKTYNGEFVDETTGYSVIFDDDGRVAYAYLLSPEEGTVADVWLYNRVSTPLNPEWSTPEKMPFANPADYAKDHTGFVMVDDIKDVEVIWDRYDPSNVRANIFIRDKLFAVLVERVKPGWCSMAKKNGPLAKKLIN